MLNKNTHTPDANKLTGEIFPQGDTSLWLQDFLMWPHMKGIIQRVFEKGRITGETFKEKQISYIAASVTPGSWHDIIERILDEQIRIVRSLVKSRSGAALNGEEKLSTGELDNEIDISGKILSELESFLVALMYIEDISVIPHRDDLKSRNAFFHLFKKRLLKKLSSSGGLSEMMRSIFLRQLKIAYKRIHPNHPVYGFIGTILYEVERTPWYFRDPPSPWFGFGAEIDEDSLKSLVGDQKRYCFWFSQITTSQIWKNIHFLKNTLLFSDFSKAFNALDVEEEFEISKKEVVLYDNAGAFSYYTDSCAHVQTIGKSPEWLQEERDPWKKEIYLWPASYSYGNNSFKFANVAGGFRKGEYDSCFTESQLKNCKDGKWDEQALHGSICSGSGKKSLVEANVQLFPESMEDGSFDHSIIRGKIYRANIYDSLRYAFLLDSGVHGNYEGINIPAKNLQGDDNTALKESISVGENSLFKLRADGGLERAIFLYSARYAILNGTAANESVWHSAGNNAKVSGTAGYQVKIIGDSFSGTDTKIEEHAFYEATVSGTIGIDAQVSGCPLESVTRTSLSAMIQKEVLPRLEQKIKILTKSIQSSFVIRNNIIENAIRKISFKEGNQNLRVSEEQDSAIQKRLNFLLSDAFRLTRREVELKMAYRSAVETGKHAEIRHASNVLDEERWRNHFKELQANPKAEVRRLEEFQKREILEKKENWTCPDNKGNPGISEELALYVIQKIRVRMANISKNMSEDAKSLALLDLLAVFSRIKEEMDHPKNILGIQSFHHAKYANITGEFFSKTLPILIGQSETERVYREYVEQEKAKNPKKRSFFPWKK